MDKLGTMDNLRGSFDVLKADLTTSMKQCQQTFDQTNRIMFTISELLHIALDNVQYKRAFKPTSLLYAAFDMVDGCKAEDKTDLAIMKFARAFVLFLDSLNGYCMYSKPRVKPISRDAVRPAVHKRRPLPDEYRPSPPPPPPITKMVGHEKVVIMNPRPPVAQADDHALLAKRARLCPPPPPPKSVIGPTRNLPRPMVIKAESPAPPIEVETAAVASTSSMGPALFSEDKVKKEEPDFDDEACFAAERADSPLLAYLDSQQKAVFGSLQQQSAPRLMESTEIKEEVKEEPIEAPIADKIRVQPGLMLLRPAVRPPHIAQQQLANRMMQMMPSTSQETLDRIHGKQHHPSPKPGDPKSKQCKYCKSWFPEFKIDHHVRTFHRDSWLDFVKKCPEEECDFRAEDEADLREHKAAIHNNVYTSWKAGMRFNFPHGPTCPFCNQSIRNFKQFINHMEVYHPRLTTYQIPYMKCTTCSFTSSHCYKMFEHWLEKSPSCSKGMHMIYEAAKKIIIQDEAIRRKEHYEQRVTRMRNLSN